MRASKQSATYADIEALPDDVIGEIVAGELFASPRPGARHVRTASVLQTIVGGPFDLGNGGGPGGWWIVSEPELHLVADVLVPDVAGWRRSRMPVFPRTNAFELAPDWVCEVLSPSTAGLDRTRKLDVYGREGVGHVWLVDPLARTLEVLRREGSRWMLAANFSDRDKARIEPFDAVELDLTLWWGDT